MARRGRRVRCVHAPRARELACRDAARARVAGAVFDRDGGGIPRGPPSGGAAPPLAISTPWCAALSRGGGGAGCDGGSPRPRVRRRSWCAACAVREQCFDALRGTPRRAPWARSAAAPSSASPPRRLSSDGPRARGQRPRGRNVPARARATASHTRPSRPSALAAEASRWRGRGRGRGTTASRRRSRAPARRRGPQEALRELAAHASGPRGSAGACARRRRRASRASRAVMLAVDALGRRRRACGAAFTSEPSAPSRWQRPSPRSRARPSRSPAQRGSGPPGSARRAAATSARALVAGCTGAQRSRSVVPPATCAR